MLVVISLMSVLAGLLLPAVQRARAAGDQARCRSNIRQLALANIMYADDRGAYVAAASDIWGANLKRWHGSRPNASSPFNSSNGPLRPYLGSSGRIRACPAFKAFSDAGFEAGCGGYGYNVRGVGSQAYRQGTLAGQASGMPADSLAQPTRTVMFADAAFPQVYAGVRVLIEYSFAEAYYHVADNNPTETYAAQPSIHFRHNGQADVAWCDGHVSAERMDFSQAAGGFAAWSIGWFGDKNNDLFDPF